MEQLSNDNLVALALGNPTAEVWSAANSELAKRLYDQRLVPMDKVSDWASLPVVSGGLGLNPSFVKDQIQTL